MSLDGTLDLTESDIGRLDYIIESRHTYCVIPGSDDDHTRAYEQVINRADIDALGHPAASYFPFDVDHIVKLCTRKGVKIELNTHAMRLAPKIIPDYRNLAKACMKHGAQIVVASVAHFVMEIGDCDVISEMLDEIRFPPEFVFNHDLEKLTSYFNAKVKVSEKFDFPANSERRT